MDNTTDTVQGAETEQHADTTQAPQDTVPAPTAETVPQEVEHDVSKVITQPVERFFSTIEEWFARHFHNSKAAQDTEIFNQLHAAKEDLKNDISKL